MNSIPNLLFAYLFRLLIHFLPSHTFLVNNTPCSLCVCVLPYVRSLEIKT